MMDGMIGMSADGSFPIFQTFQDAKKHYWGSARDNVESEKMKGTGTIGITTDGAMNAIYGPYIHNLAYNKHNTLAILGSNAYRTGRRLQEGLSYGKDDTSGVVRGGYAPAGNFGTYIQIEQPYKVLAKRTPMNLGYMEIGAKNIDDVPVWGDFFDLESDSWLWAQNNDVLRRVEDDKKVGLGSVPLGSVEELSTEVVGYESIERIISNADEGKYVKAGNNVPWKMGEGITLPSAGNPIDKYRDPDAPGFQEENNLNAYVDHNYTSPGDDTGKATLRQLTVGMIDQMFAHCMPYWDNNSTGGKAMVSGYDTVAKLQMLLQPQQRYVGQTFAQITDSGVSTVPGQSTGIMVSQYNTVPIFPDAMVQRGYGTSAGGHADEGLGRIYLLDHDSIFNGELVPIQVDVSDSSLVNNRYIRMADMHRMGEIQCSKFRSLGKIVHIR